MKVSLQTIYYMFFVSVFVLGVWINFDFKFGAFNLQGAFSIILLLMVMSFMVLFSRTPISVGYVRFFLFLLVFLIFNILLVDEVFSAFPDRLKGAGQVLLYFSLSVLFYIFSKKYVQEYQYKTLIFLVLFFVFTFSILENIGAWKHLNDTLRQMLYGNSLYESTDRDFRVYGAERPTALMREPAHLGHIVVFLVMIYLALEERVFKYLLSIIILLSALYLVKSPVVVVGLFYVGYSWFKYKKSLGKLFFFIVLVAFSTAVSYHLFSERIDGVMSGADFSFVARILGPVVVSYNVIADYPVMGVGVTADDIIYGYVYDMFHAFGFSERLKDMGYFQISKMITSYFWIHFVYMGLVGSILWVLLYVYVIRKVMFLRNYADVLIPFLLLGTLMGGFTTMKTWLIFAFIALAQYFREARHAKY